MESWNDVRVLVTGGSQGIGFGIATVFAEAGARVIIAGRNADRLKEAQASLEQRGLSVGAVSGDVSSAEGCVALAEATRAQLGGLDVLCANAGIFPITSIGDLTEDEVDEVFATNVKGTIFAVQATFNDLKASGRGRVIVTSSITGPTTGFQGLSVYAASKAAQLGFVRTAALELGPFGVTVNAVLPGTIESEGLATLPADTVERMRRAIPTGQFGAPSDIGHAVLYLASRSASFVTGQTITLDGGQTLPELSDAG